MNKKLIAKNLNKGYPVSKWIIFPDPNPKAEIRLFCFPFAGGGSLAFRPWQRELPDSIEVCAVQLPGRENRLNEPPYTRLSHALLHASFTEISPYLDRPYAIFGHSLGALVGFELIRHIRRQDSFPLPVHLFVSGRQAPDMPSSEPRIHHLSDREFMNHLRNLKGTPDAVFENRDLMELLLPLLRADFSVNESYLYTEEPLLDVPITVYGGEDDPVSDRDSSHGWSRHTSQKFQIQMFPGGHFFIQSHQSELLRSISDSLDMK
ncbi:MAG: hypothetical protein B6244_12125 [Candidatus Cloacimonetes bacterium 4572_55]|nr:MAG: hypothetical protein B6244_12125 [Candidatus Cloacimonetes bacterium 4572_55]